MKRIKQEITICFSITVICLLVMVLLKDVYMWEGMYLSNQSLSYSENQEVKTLVLSAVRDRWSSFNSTDSTEIYKESEYFNCTDIQSKNKSIFCIISPSFMKSFNERDFSHREENETAYKVTVVTYYPEYCYFILFIQKIDGDYKIVDYEIDI